MQVFEDFFVCTRECKEDLTDGEYDKLKVRVFQFFLLSQQRPILVRGISVPLPLIGEFCQEDVSGEARLYGNWKRDD